MKVKHKLKITIIRYGLFIFAICVQILFLMGLPVGLYKYLLAFLTGSIICTSILVAIYSIRFLKYREIEYICLVVECLGLFIALLLYQRFVMGFASEDITQLKRFFLFPYMISCLISFCAWIKFEKSKKRENDVISLVLDYMSANKRTAKHILNVVLLGIAVFFSFLGLYFILGLEQYLLGSWSLLTGVLAFYSTYRNW